MAMLGLDKLWGSIKRLFGFQNEEKKDEKTLAEEAKKKGEKIVDTAKEGLISKEQLTEKIKKQYWDKLVESGYIKDPKTQLGKFEKVFAEYQAK